MEKDKKENIAIIPARGGSKRIPQKNTKIFFGKPIIAYAIEAALSSNLFHEVMVSTEDPEIASIARQYGAQVPFLRSAQNADDFATTFDVIKEVLSIYQERGENYQYGCCLYPTAPFVTAELLQKGWQKLKDKNYVTVFPVLEYSFPIWRSLKVKEDQATFWWPENAIKRSQDLPKTYHDAGQFYWFNIAGILQKNMLIPDEAGVLLISELDAHDIDNAVDWEVAEWKYSYKKSREGK